MFPSQVNVVPGVGVEGDFASSNPRASVLSGPGGFVAGANGLTVGRFAWLDADGRRVNNTGAGAPTGFVAREQQALITQFLQESTMLIPVGLGATLYSAGEFWVKNAGATAAVRGQSAYADQTDGRVSFAAAGAPTVGGTSTASTIAATTSTASTIAVNSVTGSIAGNVLTVSAVATGGVFVGQTLVGAAVNPATVVTEQLSGTANGVGTYRVSIPQTAVSGTITGGAMLTVGGTVTGYYDVGATLSGTGVTAGSKIIGRGTGAGVAGTYLVDIAQTVASGAINATGGLLTIGGTVTGNFGVGDLISTGASAGTVITKALTGTGGAGTYLVNNGQTVASTAINVNANVQTKFIALSDGAPGELVKMSSFVLG